MEISFDNFAIQSSPAISCRMFLGPVYINMPHDIAGALLIWICLMSRTLQTPQTGLHTPLFTIPFLYCSCSFPWVEIHARGVVNTAILRDDELLIPSESQTSRRFMIVRLDSLSICLQTHPEHPERGIQELM